MSCSVLASRRSVEVGSKRCLWPSPSISLKLTLCIWDLIQSPVGVRWELSFGWGTSDHGSGGVLHFSALTLTFFAFTVC